MFRAWESGAAAVNPPQVLGTEVILQKKNSSWDFAKADFTIVVVVMSLVASVCMSVCM